MFHQKLKLNRKIVATAVVMFFGLALTASPVHASTGWVEGKFNKGYNFDYQVYVDAGSVYNGVKTVAFWAKGSTYNGKVVDLNGAAYISITGSTISTTGFTSPTIYVDGVAGTTVDSNWHYVTVTTGTAINASAVKFGTVDSGSLIGMLDDVKMYNYALSAREINEKYRQSSPSLAQSGTISDNSAHSALTVTQSSTGKIVDFVGDSITTGTGLALSVDGLTAGTGLDITSTSTAGGALGNSKLLNLSRSGVNANASHTAYGLYSNVINTGTTSTNVGGYFSASGATNNYGLIVNAGNVGIGVNDPDTKLEIFHAGNQLKLSYDASNFSTFATGNAGDLTITADGGDVSFGDENLLTTGTFGSGAITATSYGGITEANLLDKSAVETVSGAWTFDTSATSLLTGSTIGTLTLADGSITDSGSAISFGDENLTTTGTLGAGVTTISSAVDTSTLLTIQNTDTAIGTAGYLLELIHDANDDTDADFLICQDDGAGTPDTLFSIASDGTILMANDTWLTATDSAGTGTVNMMKINSSDAIEVGGTLVSGSFEFGEDSGLTTLVDMPVSATPAADTVEGYVFKIDGNNIMTIYAEADSAGGIQNKRVGIGTVAPTNLLSIYGATPVMDIETSDAAIIDGDDLGTIQFRGLDATQTHLIGAMIRAEASDTWDGDDVDNAPTELQFFTEDNTTDDNLATPRMVIDKDGNVGIGVNDPDTTLEVFNAGNQMKLSFDGTDNTIFAVDTTGDLTITMSGDDLLIADNLWVSDGSPAFTSVSGSGNLIVENLISFDSDYRQGCDITYKDAATITIGPGEVMIGEMQDKAEMRKNTSSTDVTWTDIDTGSEAVGTNYFVYAVADTVASTFTIKISVSHPYWTAPGFYNSVGDSTAPTGLTKYRLLGYFHNDAESNINRYSVANNTNLNGKTLAAGIPLPGMVKIPSGDFAVDIYEATANDTSPTSGTAADWIAVSAYNAAPWTVIQQSDSARGDSDDAFDACENAGKRLISSEEYLIAAQQTPDPHTADPADDTEGCLIWNADSEQKSKPASAVWAGTTGANSTCANNGLAAANTCYSAAGSTYYECTCTGTNKSASYTCESKYGVRDMVGNVWEWNSDIRDMADSDEGGWRAVRDDWFLPDGSISTNAFSGYSSVTYIDKYGQDGVYLGATGTRAFHRGGHWADGARAGVFSLALDAAPTATGWSIGFRCSR